jgi:hypothetical protein
MLEALFNNRITEKVFFYLVVYKEGHPRGIASAYNGHPTSYINQLKKLERGGVLVSRLKGRTRIYSFNPRYPFKKELEALLEKALIFMPAVEKKKYYTPRLRPRWAGKPL